MEEILRAGGFFLKPWVRSGQSGRQANWEAEGPGSGQSTRESGVIILPNQMKEGESRALGVGYLVQEDKLYIISSINFSRRRKKIRTGQDLLEKEVREKTPDPLTRRELLS